MSTLAFDASPLAHFARAGRLGTLERLVERHRNVTTRAVLDELRRGEHVHPELTEVRTATWLAEERTDDLRVLGVLAVLVPLLGAGDRNMGEVTVMAWCRVHDGVAILDDKAARNVARREGITYKGSLALVAEGMRTGALTDRAATEVVDDLLDTGARLPSPVRGRFGEWARDEGLLDAEVR